MNWKVLFVLIFAGLLQACAYSLDYNFKDVEGNVVKGTDVNTVHLLSKGTHVGIKYFCDAQGDNCRKYKDDDFNAPVLGTIGQPVATAYGADRIGSGLSDSGDNVSLQGSSASAASSSKSSAISHGRAAWHR